MAIHPDHAPDFGYGLTVRIGFIKINTLALSLERHPMAESVKGTFLPLMQSQSVITNFQYIEITDEGHNTSPLIAFHKGLISIHRMTKIPDEIAEGDLALLSQHLIDLAGNHGLPTDEPDPNELQFFREYLEWVQARTE